MPYSRCFKANYTYCVAPKSTRYGKCVYAEKSCNKNNMATFYRFPFSLVSFLANLL